MEATIVDPTPAENRALEFAINAHGGQKYGEQPYSVHLIAVAHTLWVYGADEPLIVAGYLHDTIEDTKTTVEDLRVEFGQEVADLVWAVTGVGANRKERCASAYVKMKAYPRSVTLKLADRLVNVETAKGNKSRQWGMYCKEHPKFVSELRPHGPAVMWNALDELFAPEHERNDHA